jgi:hypothetical protein
MEDAGSSVSRETLWGTFWFADRGCIGILREEAEIGQCTTQVLSDVQALACFASWRELFVSREGAKLAKETMGEGRRLRWRIVFVSREPKKPWGF